MIVALLIVHGLLATALLGAITHQVIVTFAAVRGRRENFVASVRGVRGHVYPSAVLGLYLLTFMLGAVIYPEFRVAVRTQWDSGLPAATGLFEIKEHFAAVGLGVLPAYWASWRITTDQAPMARAAATALIATVVWYDFIAGHVLNNIDGL